MTSEQYHALTGAQMRVKRWRLVRAVNLVGGVVLPAGEAVEIVRKFGGLTIDVVSSGVRARRVRFDAVEEITEGRT